MLPTWTWPLAAALACSISWRTASGSEPMARPAWHKGSYALGSARIDGMRLSELSGLAWDGQTRQLYAISDRGVLFELALSRNGSDLTSVQPLNAWPVRPDEGRQAKHPDIEALTLVRSPSVATGRELWMVVEDTARVIRMSPEGRVLGHLEPPASLLTLAGQSSQNRFVESLAWHPDQGLWLAAERPTPTPEGLVWQIHGPDRVLSVPIDHAQPIRLKAMDWDGQGRLILLERLGDSERPSNRLRQVDFDRCRTGMVCSASTLLVIQPKDGADNFEGMTWLGDGQLLLVSDNQGRAARPSVFLLVRLPEMRK